MNDKNILFAVFDLNDNNYMKMPWALFIRTLPIIAEKYPNLKIYVLTDTKNCTTVKKILERKNIKVISLSRPVLRYPYTGLLTTLRALSEELDIDTIVATCGWNPHIWSVIADKLKIRNLTLMVFTPLYSINDLLRISSESFTSLLRYGGFTDIIYFVKLLYENFVIRLLLSLTKPRRNLRIIVFTESGKKLFQKYKFETYKINTRLEFNIANIRRNHTGTPAVAYFGVPIIARGYDIIIRLARNLDINFVMYLRESSQLSTKVKTLLKNATNVKVTFKFFHSADDLIFEAGKYPLVLLPFRFVVSDFPLVVLETLCSGRPVVTTQFSNLYVINAPNLIVLDISQVKNPYLIKRLAEKNIKIEFDSCKIDWDFIASELAKALGLR